MTLEELKGLSDGELIDAWQQGVFPFDCSPCGGCLTLHTMDFGTTCGRAFFCHKELSSAVAGILGTNFYINQANLPKFRENLEKLYALRLFFDHIYEQRKEITNGVEETKQEEEKVSL